MLEEAVVRMVLGTVCSGFTITKSIPVQNLNF